MGRWVESLPEQVRGLLPEAVWRYYTQGARAGVSAAEATAAWDSFRFLPRVLRDVSEVRTSAEVLGTSVRGAVGIAPTTLQRAAHPDGELAMARAVHDFGGLLVASSNGGTSFAEIGATGVAWWIQMYVTQDRSASEPVLAAAVAAGARAVVLTADTPVVGTKYDDGPTVWEVADPDWLRVNFAGGQEEDAASWLKATDLGPGDIEWLGRQTGVPVVVKGVLRADDAVRCVDAGAAAVWVSNHGGRQLDRAVATATALPAVVEAVNGRVPVYVDGGIRSAGHVATALALGAQAAFVGRSALFALTLAGSEGVHRLLAELDADLVETLQLLGCADVDELPDSGVLLGPPPPYPAS